MPRGSLARVGAPLLTFHVDTERGWRGGEQQMAYLLDGLVRRGHKAVVAVQPDGEARRRLEAAGHDVRPVPMRGEADPVAVLALARKISAARADVVHCHTSHAHTLGALAARLAGRPAVIVSRRVDFSIYRNSFLGLNGIKYRAGVDRIVCVSDAVRDVLLRDGLLPERLRVVRSAVDPRRIRSAPPVDVRARLSLPPSARIVLAVGALVPHKGHRFLVEAMPRLVAEVKDAHVVIAGEGPLRKELQELAKPLWIDRRLVLAGQVDDLAGWFASAEVLAMPSLEEGLGTSVLDAMSVGVPVVASRAGGLPEMVRDGVEGLLVPPGDPKALSDALVRVLSDADLRARLSADARRRVDEAFHVDRMVDETVAVYEEALRERRAPDVVASPL
jgi:L-malate glycosyltransferase